MTVDHLTDRIPEVLNGGAGWTAAEEAHLGRCDVCQAEWHLVVEARNHAAPRARVDADRIAGAVLARLRAEPVVLPMAGRRRWLRPVVLVAAAAASIALLVVFDDPVPRDDRAAVPAREPTMLPELDQLLESELEVILAMFPEDPVAAPRSQTRLGDLTDGELEQLLEEMDG
jgi:hypothetical protein